MFQLGCQGLAGAMPISLARLEFQQDVLHLFVLGPDGKGPLGQVQGGFGVAGCKSLLHDAPNADETRGISLEQPLVHLFGFFGIAGHFSRLRGDQIGQIGFLQIALCLGSFGHGHTPLA